ncbi:hypothetical protein [Anaerotignum sp.]|uniref:hypothetical protein n=1 Tax=Anaerotignum sp. TaxID=2039241 RepID=UPI0028A05E7A|nr:hypothetical protein [Anaerotignum sp.]
MNKNKQGLIENIRKIFDDSEVGINVDVIINSVEIASFYLSEDYEITEVANSETIKVWNCKGDNIIPISASIDFSLVDSYKYEEIKDGSDSVLGNCLEIVLNNGITFKFSVFYL